MRLTALQQLYVKKQAAAGTYGFSATPTAADLLEVFECTPPKIDGDVLARSGNARGAHTPLPARPGPRHYSGAASCDMVLPTTQALLDKYHAAGAPFRSMLEAADLECTKSTTNAIYTPKSNQGVILSAWHYLDGLIYKGLDCKTGFTLTMDAGAICKFAFTLNGRYYDVATGAMAPVTTTTFANAHVAESATSIFLQIGYTGYAIDFSKLELQWNPTVKMRKGHKGQYGEIGSIITGREPKCVITPSMEDMSDVPIIGGWEAMTMCLLTYEVYPYFTLYVHGQIASVPVEDEDGEGRHNLEIRMASETTENELQMSFIA